MKAPAAPDPFSPGRRSRCGSPRARRPARKPRRSGPCTSSRPTSPTNSKAACTSPNRTNNPFGSLFALYLVAEDPALGSGSSSPARSPQRRNRTGHQHLHRHAAGPVRRPEAALLRRAASVAEHPALCGSYTTLAAFTPWSSPGSATAKPASRSPRARRRALRRPAAFAPACRAGSGRPQAGAFTSFTLTLDRPRRRPGLTGAQRAPAAGDRGDPRLGHALPRTAGRRTDSAARKA